MKTEIEKLFDTAGIGHSNNGLDEAFRVLRSYNIHTLDSLDCAAKSEPLHLNLLNALMLLEKACDGKVNCKTHLLLVSFLDSCDETLSCYATSKLPYTPYKTVEKRLKEILLCGQREFNQTNAAYVLSWSKTNGMGELFCQIFSDESFAPSTRAQVAEGIGYFYTGADRRTKSFQKAGNCLVTGLTDKFVDVRFWCCFALGSIGYRPAIPDLEKLARTDKSLLKGWWWVRWEARDAITRISGGEPPERRRV